MTSLNEFAEWFMHATREERKMHDTLTKILVATGRYSYSKATLIAYEILDVPEKREWPPSWLGPNW